MRVTEANACIGAHVTDVDVHDLRDADIAADLDIALERYGVLVFRGLEIDDDTQIALAAKLGRVETFPAPPDRRPEIFIVSLDPAKTRSASYLRGTMYWHIDGATDDVPTKATLLRAVELADKGGETEFCNTYASWDALPDADKATYQDLRVLHSFEAAQLLDEPNPTAEQLAFWRTRPPKQQPLAWKHRSGRTSLVLGATTSHVVGMNEEEGRTLLARLVEWATNPKFVYRHEWQKGDLVIWDNRGVMHRVLPYTSDSGRLMHRTTLVGDEAFV